MSQCVALQNRVLPTSAQKALCIFWTLSSASAPEVESAVKGGARSLGTLSQMGLWRRRLSPHSDSRGKAAGFLCSLLCRWITLSLSLLLWWTFQQTSFGLHFFLRSLTEKRPSPHVQLFPSLCRFFSYPSPTGLQEVFLAPFMPLIKNPIAICPASAFLALLFVTSWLPVFFPKALDSPEGLSFPFFASFSYKSSSRFLPVQG